MKVTLIDAKDAPTRPVGPTSKRTAMVDALVSSLAPGTVARVELEERETARGAKASLTRAAKRLGRELMGKVR